MLGRSLVARKSPLPAHFAVPAPGNWISNTAIPAISKTACWSLFTVSLASATMVRAQSAVDGFDPNANGTVLTVVVQPDGKILIGGDFTTLSPNGGGTVTRNHIARLNPDGTLDSAFNPNASGEVDAIAVQADGKVLVGGVFTTIGGQSRNFLARLDGTSGAADSFNPSPNSDVLAIAVQADGKILVGGDFNNSNGTPTIGGATRNNIARLNPTTGLADSFDPNTDSTVYTIVAQANGQVLVGGNFNTLVPNGGAAITRNHIARLNSTGLADSFAPNAHSIVYAIATQADGTILVGGAFSGTNSIGGQTRNYIARLDPATGLADSFNPNATAQVNAVAVQADGKIVVGGNFSGASSIGGQTRGRIARLDPVTGLADSFDPEANAPILVIALQQDGKVLASGQFTTMAPNGAATVTRNHIARLETNGSLDQTLNPSLVDNGAITKDVAATAIQADGKILIGGDFMISGQPQSNIARLNTNGTLDAAFNPYATSTVYAIAAQADGQILVGGFFGAIGEHNHSAIARLDATGSDDSSFNPSANDVVHSIVVQTDGKILLGGHFTRMNTQTRNRIARLNPDGTLDFAFDPNANDNVYSIALQSDGKILVSGHFSGSSSIGGQALNFLARLDPTTGAADTSFNPNPDNDVLAITVQTDGKILVGGSFSNIGGQQRKRIARLNQDGTLDMDFECNSIGETVDTIALQADGAISVGTEPDAFLFKLDMTGTEIWSSTNGQFGNNTPVYSVALQADGKILVGGGFANLGGQPRNSFARFTNDTGAVQNLTVTQSTITWTRSGSSPQFTRVTFESSTDNVNYTLLGNGAPSGSGWTLTGLSLPTGQNIYIRARGYYSGGFENGSGSIAESVRNAFIPAVLKITSITRSANGHIVLQCLGLPNQVNDLQVSPDLSPDSFTTISPPPVVPDGTGAFSYDDAGAVGLTKRFYSLAFP
jgi:uncharacterized delta-60 repeat protein